MVERLARPAAEILAEGRRRYEGGDLDDAGPLAIRALELRPRGSDPAARSEALQLAAEVLFGRGSYAEARELAQEAAVLRAGEGDEERAETENLLGILDLSMGDASAGLARVESAYRIRERVLGEDHPDTLESLNNVGVALGRVGRMPEALAAHEEALRRCERAFDSPHRQLAVSLNGLAVKLERTPEGRDRAHALSLRALDAAEAALGPEHPYVAMLMSNVATNRVNAKDLEAARPLVERSLDLHVRRIGPTSPSTATAMLTAAEVAFADGRLEDAQDLLDRALGIRLDTFGIQDPRSAAVVRRLVSILGARMQDPSIRADAIAVYGAFRLLDPAAAPTPGVVPLAADPEGADRAMRGYLRRRADRLPPEDPAVRRNLDRARTSLIAADSNFMAGDLDAAAVAAEDAIVRLEEARGPSHLDLVEPLRRRSAIERALDRADVALRLDARALEILAASYGEFHPYVLREMSRLAVDAGREYGYAASRPGLERLREILSASPYGSPAARVRANVDRFLEQIPEGEADPIALSERRRTAAGAVAPLATELLPDLEGVPWATIAGPHGSAATLPGEIRLLLSDDPRVVRDAAGRVASTVLHLGTLHPASAPAIPFLLRLLEDERVSGRPSLIGILTLVLATAIEARGRARQHGHPVEPDAAAVLTHEAAIARTFGRLAEKAPGLREHLAWARRELEGVRAVASGGRSRLD